MEVHLRNPLERWEQRRARKRYMPEPRTSKAGTTAKLALVLMAVIIGVAALLELRSGGGAEADLVEYAQQGGVDPVDLAENAARSRRLLFIADIPTAPAPKQYVQRVIERVATTSGLDLVVLDIDSDEQPYIDRYLATAPEDASILLSRPRAVREGDGASRAILDIYRTVWRVNQQLGAARRIRIVAADAQGWPPSRATSPADAATLFGARADRMVENVVDRALGRSPNARVLFFVDGLQALRSGSGRVQTGGARPVETTWLAAQMRQRYPSDVYTILVDAAPSRSIAADVAAYRGTAFADPMRRGGIASGTGLTVNASFDELTRTPIRVVGTTGLDFSLEPRATPMSELADAYVYFGS
jgi:hypothetical protein